MRITTVEQSIKSEKSYHLVRRLGSRHAEERRAARAEFMHMATDDPALFHTDLADIIRAITGNRRQTSLVIAALVLSFPVAYVALIACLLLTAVVRGGPVALLAAITVGIPTALVSVGILKVRRGSRRKRLAECITDIDDLNALPALIELLEYTKPAVQQAILPPITRMLLRLRTSDAYLLGFLHRSALARSLSMPGAHKLPTPFLLAVLQAFEQIGDSQVLPAVTWLAQGKGAGRNNPTVQDAAQACLTHLQAQRNRHQAPYTLLRPSSAADAPHILLRPVANTPDSAPHELLRAEPSPSNEPWIAAAFTPLESPPELSINRIETQGNL